MSPPHIAACKAQLLPHCTGSGLYGRDFLHNAHMVLCSEFVAKAALIALAITEHFCHGVKASSFLDTGPTSASKLGWSRSWDGAQLAQIGQRDTPCYIMSCLAIRQG